MGLLKRMFNESHNTEKTRTTKKPEDYILKKQKPIDGIEFPDREHHLDCKIEDISDKIVDLTLDLLDFIGQEGYQLVTNNVATLIPRALLMSLVGYYSLDQAYFNAQAQELNNRLSDSMTAPIDSILYDRFLNIFNEQCNSSNTETSPLFDAAVNLILIVSASTVDIQKTSDWPSFRRKCKQVFGDLLLYSSKDPSIKKYVKKDGHVDESETEEPEFDALSKTFFIAAHDIMNYCSSKGYDEYRDMAYPLLSCALLRVFVLFYEMSADFESKRVNGLNEILERINLMTIDDAIRKYTCLDIAEKNESGKYYDMMESAAYFMTDVLEESIQDESFENDREDIRLYCEKTIRNMMKQFQKLFTSPEAIKRMM